jgi:hypothetical protein
LERKTFGMCDDDGERPGRKLPASLFFKNDYTWEVDLKAEKGDESVLFINRVRKNNYFDDV